MPYANKQKAVAYKNEYNNDHYARLALTMLPDEVEMIRNAAKRSGQSYSQYVLQAVRERMLRDATSKTD